MNKPSIDEILAIKPNARPRIYAYSIADDNHKGLLKVGQTIRDVKLRVAEQLKTAAIKNYTIVLVAIDRSLLYCVLIVYMQVIWEILRQWTHF